MRLVIRREANDLSYNAVRSCEQILQRHSAKYRGIGERVDLSAMAILQQLSGGLARSGRDSASDKALKAGNPDGEVAPD